MLLLPEGCLVRLLLPLLFLLREFDEAEDEADLSSSDNTTVIEGQLENWTDFCLLKAIEKLDNYEKMYLFLIIQLNSKTPQNVDSGTEQKSTGDYNLCYQTVTKQD